MAALGLLLLVVLAAAAAAPLAGATSMKMDYLRLANVRTDPITHPNGLSGHVHSFFGVTEVAPDTTYADLRNAAGNTGNVKENKSLYWHPAIYRYDKRTRRYSLQDTSLFSVYYIWPTGDTTAFPDGLKILAGGTGYAAQSRPEAGCSEPGPCPDGDCERWNDFFPPTSCGELEMSMVMPSCWDGINLDSADHRAHMAYPKRSEADGDCPDTHPVRLPQIELYTRIEPYLGGIHLFSDGTGDFHADYFSGWDSDFLQSVLDECENEFMWVSPEGWCEDHVTFRDAPKDPELEDDELRDKLVPLQPDPAFDPSDISDEAVDDVESLPGDNQPIVDITQRCGERFSKRACRKLRLKDTEFPLGGKYAKWRACTWKRGRCRAKYADACEILEGRRKCRRFGAASGCIFEEGECFHDEDAFEDEDEDEDEDEFAD